MGSGYGANYADVVGESFVRETLEISGESFTLLDVFYDSFDGEISENFNIEEWSDAQKQMYERIKRSFKLITGLSLFVGDRYDEVDGVFWRVEGVYELTKSGEKYREYISRCLFVTYG